jgi:hypothetical protein
MNADDKVKLAVPKEGWGSYLRVNLTKKFRKHSAQQKKCYHFQVGEESSKGRIAIKFIRHETNKETREFAAADHAADEYGFQHDDGHPHLHFYPGGFWEGHEALQNFRLQNHVCKIDPTYDSSSIKGAYTTVDLRRCSDSIDGEVLSTTPEKNVYSCVAGVQLLENTLGDAVVRISFPKLARDTEGNPISPIDFSGGYYANAKAKEKIAPDAGDLSAKEKVVGAAGAGFVLGLWAGIDHLGAVAVGTIVSSAGIGAAVLGGAVAANEIHDIMKRAREENFLHSPALKLWDKLRTHPNFHKCNDSTLVPRQPKLVIGNSLRENGLDRDGCPLGELFPVEKVNAMPASSSSSSEESEEE